MTPIRCARQCEETPVPATPRSCTALILTAHASPTLTSTPARASPAPILTSAQASPAPNLPSTPGKGKTKAKDPGTYTLLMSLRNEN